MPINNNRNSRDDKSGKSKRPVNQSKNNRFNSERPSTGNRPDKDLFGSDRNSGDKKSARWSSEKGSDSRTERGTKGGSRFEKKPFGDKSPRPYIKSDRNREKNPGDNRFGDERKPYADRKPFGDKKFGGERKPFGDRKDFGDSDRRTGGDRPFNRDRADFRGRPREDRKWTSEERVSSGNRSKKPALPKEDGMIRLNRYIANAGICSRRKADELIQAGVVSVNGQVISELGFKVDPAKDEIRYNGETLKREKMVYVLLNKPKDYITTTDDPHERRTVMQLVEKASRERIYPVGRLDRNTTGLLLMTNDGDLADKLSHPRNNITKIYQVELNKNFSQGDLNKLSFGIELEDGPIKPDSVSYVQGGSKREVGIQIHSGKNRIVRRMFEHLGYDVVKLDRVVYANLTKKDLPRGRWRYLDEKEIIQLKHLMK